MEFPSGTSAVNTSRSLNVTSMVHEHLHVVVYIDGYDDLEIEDAMFTYTEGLFFVVVAGPRERYRVPIDRIVQVDEYGTELDEE